jgi:hypothetical protein
MVLRVIYTFVPSGSCEDPQRGTSGKHCSRLHIYRYYSIQCRSKARDRDGNIYEGPGVLVYTYFSHTVYKEVGLYLSTLAYLLT